MLSGTPCGANATQTSVVPYVGHDDTIPAALDFHLKPGKHPAVNYVPSSTVDSDLAFDKDGQRRSSPRDAGADER